MRLAILGRGDLIKPAGNLDLIAGVRVDGDHSVTSRPDLFGVYTIAPGVAFWKGEMVCWSWRSSGKSDWEGHEGKDGWVTHLVSRWWYILRRETG